MKTILSIFALIIINTNCDAEIENTNLISISDTSIRLIAQPYELVIDEIMADPTPAVGLPNCEWIEIRNISAHAIDLLNWKLAKSNSISGSMKSFILQPDSSVIICSSTSLNQLIIYGAVLSVTYFPSLSNSSDLIYLVSPEGKTIHAVDYNDTWYRNELKKQGGWTLEMIDLNNPCAGAENWSASNASIGGTPGKINSIDAVNLDLSNPELLRAYAIDSLQVMLVFNEPLDSVESANTNHYYVNNGIGYPLKVTVIQPVFNTVQLQLKSPFQKGIIYEIVVDGIKDCIGNAIENKNKSKFALFQQLDSFDVVINEILFNPNFDGVDYIEMVNRSNKPLNLKNLYLANADYYGHIDNIIKLSEKDILFFSGEYLLITENAYVIKRDFFTPFPERILQLNSMPSMNDDKGTLFLLNDNGKIIDQLSYQSDWHFKLLDNVEGVSLERIDINAPTQNKENWHSAATSVGYGTPTYKNSQNNISTFNNEQNIIIDPLSISPNNDGVNDFLKVNYSFKSPGYVANITIFDQRGRFVKSIANNAVCGISGFFSWDGLNQNGQQLPTGIYIVCSDLFNLKGEIKKCKNAIVLKQ